MRPTYELSTDSAKSTVNFFKTSLYQLMSPYPRCFLNKSTWIINTCISKLNINTCFGDRNIKVADIADGVVVLKVGQVSNRLLHLTF